MLTKHKGAANLLDSRGFTEHFLRSDFCTYETFRQDIINAIAKTGIPETKEKLLGFLTKHAKQRVPVEVASGFAIRTSRLLSEIECVMNR